MKYLSPKTKDAFRAAYKSAWRTELRECYKTWSSAKQNAYDYERRLCYDAGGENFRILSSTSDFFTIGFVFPDAETGVLMLHIATGRNTYEFEY